MTTKQNLHSHCSFCDGQNSIEELIQEAISIGFDSIGISSHAVTGVPFMTWHMPEDQVESYYQEMERLKEKFKKQIKVFKGLELENVAGLVPDKARDKRLDFTIGSNHFFRTPKGFFTADTTLEACKSAIDAYSGYTLGLVEDYLKDFLLFAKTSSFEILGHLDLFTKFNEREPLFEENDPSYQSLVLDYTKSIAATGKIFEVNTGAMAKGYKTHPYPAKFVLKYLNEINAPVIIESDCHNAAKLAYYFEETEQLLRSIGFTSQMKLTDQGFISVPL